MGGAAVVEAVPALPWHHLTIGEVFRLLETDPARGITNAEALHRQMATFGRNVMTPAKRLGFFGRLWAQVNNILIWILLAAAVVSGVLAEWAEVALIVLVVAVNCSIGLMQEGKAEKAAEALKAMLAPHCTVLRDGARMTLDAAELVPGDVVFLQSGDRVPADIRLFDVSKLSVLEALLTGESLPISKNTHTVPPKSPLGDRKCMCFSATLVMSGQALGVVVETGDFTELGTISALVSGTESGRTNLTVQLEIFGRWISAIVAVIAVSTLLLAHFGRGEPIGAAFTSAVAVAVAIIPEGLPAVVTIVLAIATQAMAAKHAIIKSLPAVETLGSVTVICSDKTGTLTKNEMTAVTVRTASRNLPVSGVGYAPMGSIHAPDGAELSPDALARLRPLLLAGVLCSDGNLREPTAVGVTMSGGEGGQRAGGAAVTWTPVGDPTEVALITLARKAGCADIRAVRASAPRVGTVPFESDYKFMATAHAVAAGAVLDFPGVPVGSTVVCVKGAPDRLIPRCLRQVCDSGIDDAWTTAPMDEAFWQAEVSALSRKGLRVLALCRGELPSGVAASDLSSSTITGGTVVLTMVCLVAILDPPRDEAVTAIAEAHSAGISVKMITGDHRDTALAIGRMLHIADEGHCAYTGLELDAMSDAQLDAVVMGCNVFARASPENKIRIVKALQRLGQVCSMTGDGVNDAPALKAANIGVAMGITGTDVSKEAAKMVLAGAWEREEAARGLSRRTCVCPVVAWPRANTFPHPVLAARARDVPPPPPPLPIRSADDNFATIVEAVREGRRVWDNLVKIMTYNTPVNIAQGAWQSRLPGPTSHACLTLRFALPGMTTFFAYALNLDHPPLTALATLYINMITSVAMGMAFSFELPEADIMTRPPRAPGTRLFSMEVMWRNVFVGGLMIIAVLLGYELGGGGGEGRSLTERRGEAFTQLVFCEIAYVFNCRFLRSTSLTLDVFRGNIWILASITVTAGLQVLIIYTPVLSAFFYSTGISAASWGRVLGLAAAVFFIVELEKQVLHLLRPALARAVGSIAGAVPAAMLIPVPHAAGRASAAGQAPTSIELNQAELDSVRFVATSASSFGIPLAAGVPGKPGEAGQRPQALSTADLLIAANSAQVRQSRANSPVLSGMAYDGRLRTVTLSAIEAQLPAIAEHQA
jgi:magnesium-transporting ATPase (P-type)